MKCKFTTVLATILTAGMACTVQAANPFSDVPTGHWAYDSITQLAAAGVIEGYGDDSFRGDRLMTRYEMAQIVARAMAKGARVDKLATEFANELDTLGVRVSELEKKSDNVKWNGSFLARYWHSRKADDGEIEKVGRKLLTARLEPTFTINDNWSGHARIEANFNGGTVEPVPTLFKRIWVQGDYKNFQVLGGRIPYLTNVDNGMIYDHELDAVQATFGNKVKATVTYGKTNRYDAVLDENSPTGGNYQAIEIYNDRDAKFTWGLGFHRWHDRTTTNLYEECGVSSVKIFEVGLGYKFDKNWSANGIFAWTNSPDAEHEPGDPPEKCSSESKRAFSIELDYKKADPAVKNSFGLFAAYRQLGHYVVIAPTYDTTGHGERGLEIGGEYVFAKNMIGAVKYFVGQKMPDEVGPGEVFQSAQAFYTEFKVLF